MTLEKGKKLGPYEILSNIATTDLWGAYDVLPDGDFVVVEPAEWEEKPARIHVVTNWATELGKDSTPRQCLPISTCEGVRLITKGTHVGISYVPQVKVVSRENDPDIRTNDNVLAHDFLFAPELRLDDASRNRGIGLGVR